MGKTTDAKISDFDGSDFTEVTFNPDLEKFKMETLDKDIVALLTRRAYDIAGTTKGVRVILNGNKLPVSLPPHPHHLKLIKLLQEVLLSWGWFYYQA